MVFSSSKQMKTELEAAAEMVSQQEVWWVAEVPLIGILRCCLPWAVAGS